ncbi:MAG: ribonuclease domain-containing protein [Elusimicrobiaceae bacterium]|nr:ribonuclease domain-containing protein [Elusimicrobiaceae bacterium]
MKRSAGRVRFFALLFSMFFMAVSTGAAGQSSAPAAKSALSGLASVARSAGIKFAQIVVPADNLEFRGNRNSTRDGNREASSYPPSAAFERVKGFRPSVNDAKRNTKMIDVLSRIYSGAQLDFSKDGTVFSNRDLSLPKHEYGYYREYTLLVPGRQTGDPAEPVDVGGTQYTAGPVLSTRGAERLIIGGGKTVYYTPDHYVTFIELTPVSD